MGLPSVPLIVHGGRSRGRRRRLRLLVVSSRPAGVPAVSIEEETKGLRAAFRDLARRGLAAIETLPRATPARLQRRLAQGGVDVLHFAGHGEFDKERGEGSVLMEDERGRPRLVGQEAFRQLVAGRGLRLVFLNACESGRGGRVEWSRGVAPALVAAGLPAVEAGPVTIRLIDNTVSFGHRTEWGPDRPA